MKIYHRDKFLEFIHYIIIEIRSCEKDADKHKILSNIIHKLPLQLKSDSNLSYEFVLKDLVRRIEHSNLHYLKSYLQKLDLIS